MNRSLKSAALTAALATAALVSVPAVASADAYASTTGPAPVIACDGNCQIAGGSIFNAGRDNIVGDGADTPGVGLPAPAREFTISVGAGVHGLSLASQYGSGNYPSFLFTNSLTVIQVDGPSRVEYRTLDGQGLVRITVNDVGQEEPVCLSGGTVTCRVERSFFGPEVQITLR